MDLTLTLSMILISLALLFYSLGVWAERITKYLKTWHLFAFWTGFLFDVLGTYQMSKISGDPFDISDPHTLTGQIAIWLMLVHAIWASVVVIKKNERAKNYFHKFSLVVWLIWLIPYFGGMFMGMAH